MIKHGVVVGYDGSPHCERALTWAIEEARVRRTTLTLCHVWQIPYPGIVVPATDEVQDAARLLLAGGADQARAAAPDLTVQELLVYGSAARTLTEFGASADMVVVGTHGVSGMRELVLGSVSAHVSSHGTSPVVVVRGWENPPPEYYPGRVVAGVDGSSATERVLQFAFEEAQAHGLPLTAVCAWPEAAQWHTAQVPFVNRGELARIADERFHQVLERWREKYPAVDAQGALSSDAPVQALANAATAARILVLGSRGLGAVRGKLLGSVSQAMLHQSPCPVAIIH